jgi:two-component system alkaline phosphatase synthesis response regulator PhoP
MKKIVFVVDDEPDIRESVKTLLEQEGYEVETAENGQEFLNKTKRSSPDLVLLDIMMPGLSTNDILSRLRLGSKQVKIIFMTVVRLSEEERNRLLKKGNIVDYITKPFDLNDLLERVKKAA